MAAQPPGALKGDGKNSSDIPGDDPSNYTGCAPALYDYKMQLKALYVTDTVQLIVAGVIFANFIVVMFSVTQYVLDNPSMENTLEIFDKIFIYFFLFELAINMFTSAQAIGEPALITPWFWSWEFWVGENWGWNWFDFIVIVIPVALGTVDWASSIRILRLFRVIRVLKSIAKFEALQVVASSVSRSMSGVGATAIFILICVCMYSIIAVEMFGKEAVGISPKTDDTPEWDLRGKKYVDMTWRQRYGYANADCEGVPLFKHFGNLRRSMLTMFVFTTVEGWPDLGWCLGKTYAFGSAFCTSFIIITALLMANIVVAIFTNKMEEAQEEVEKEQKALRAQRQASISRAFAQAGGLDNTTIQGVDLDGDGIADEFVIDADGDGIADVVLTKEEMAQIWTVGEPIEVYSHTIMQWCSGQVKEVNHKDKRIKVEYDVDGNTLGEKTIPFKHDSIRRPAGAAIGGKAVKVVAGKSQARGPQGNIENMGELTNILKSFQSKLDAIATKVDTLMSDKSQKGRTRP